MGRRQALGREQRRKKAQIARWEERRRKNADKQAQAEQRRQHELHVQRQQGEATKQTMKVEQRVQKLTNVLQASLANENRPLDFEAMKPTVTLPSLDLGQDAHAEQPPRWKDFAPSYRTTLVHLLGRRRRRMQVEAKNAFDQAMTQHREREDMREQRVAAARRRYDDACAQAQSQVREKNRDIDLFHHRVLNHDRHAASRYFQLVLDRATPDSLSFPEKARVGYVPESSTLTIEWVLPGTNVIPPEKEYRYAEDHDEIVVHKWRSNAEIRQIHQTMAAQIALRTLNTVFGSDPGDLVETVMVNGVVEDVGEITGRAVRLCVLTLCATRTQFKRLKIHDLPDAVGTVRKSFGARFSDRPEDFVEVPALLPFALADPTVIEPAGTVASDDRRPDLLTFSLEQLKQFLAELFDRMGLDVDYFSPAETAGLDCVVHDPTPATGGRIVVHTTLDTQVVPPSRIRAVNGLATRESAIKAIVLTTSGFHPSTYGFATGKPIELYDGHSFLALCHQHGMPARISRVANTCRPHRDLDHAGDSSPVLPLQRAGTNDPSLSPRIS